MSDERTLEFLAQQLADITGETVTMGTRPHGSTVWINCKRQELDASNFTDAVGGLAEALLQQLEPDAARLRTAARIETEREHRLRTLVEQVRA